MAKDVCTFFRFAAEPEHDDRKRMGLKVRNFPLTSAGGGKGPPFYPPPSSRKLNEYLYSPAKYWHPGGPMSIHQGWGECLV